MGVTGVQTCALPISYGKGIKHLNIKKDANSPAVAPTMENVLAAKYPISRYLYWYVAGQPQGDARKLVDWVYSKDGQEIVEKVGYYPLNDTDRSAFYARVTGGPAKSALTPVRKKS